MGSCMSTESTEPPVRQFQTRDPQPVVSYPPPVVKPSAPPYTQPQQPQNYMQAYTYAQMNGQQGTQWVQTPYQYQVYPPQQLQQQRYYVPQPQQQQMSPATAFVGGVVAGAVVNSMLDYDDPY